MKKNAKECYICQQPFPEGNNTNMKKYKVVDHDHLSGKVRGIAHNECNL
jgi:hypothetical protein